MMHSSKKKDNLQIGHVAYAGFAAAIALIFVKGGR
jgi:hypothetical protein